MSATKWRVWEVRVHGRFDATTKVVIASLNCTETAVDVSAHNICVVRRHGLIRSKPVMQRTGCSSAALSCPVVCCTLHTARLDVKLAVVFQYQVPGK